MNTSNVRFYITLYKSQQFQDLHFQIFPEVRFITVLSFEVPAPTLTQRKGNFEICQSADVKAQNFQILESRTLSKTVDNVEVHLKVSAARSQTEDKERTADFEKSGTNKIAWKHRTRHKF